jgi:PAS domain S-box-containing protein
MPDGGVVCEGILLNITGHRRAAEALVESQARNQAILSALPDMMFVLGADGTYVDVHVSDAQRLLLPPDQFLGKNMSEILSPELAQLFRACFEQVRTQGRRRWTTRWCCTESAGTSRRGWCRAAPTRS